MDHAFWELQDETLAIFWSDSRQQLLALEKDPTLNYFIPLTSDAGLHKVVELWIPKDTRDN
jgi:hypothetical protein